MLLLVAENSATIRSHNATAISGACPDWSTPQQIAGGVGRRRENHCSPRHSAYGMNANRLPQTPMRIARAEIPDWLELTRSADFRERRKALHALCPCELKSHVPRVWERVLEMAGDPHAGVRRSIVHALCDGSPAIYQADIIRALESLYHDPDRGVRRMVRNVLARYRHSGSVNVL